jgi:hypothetical protein
MHFAHPPITLSSADYARLQQLMLTMIGSRTVIAAIVRRKLGSGTPGPSSSLRSDRAVSGKQVRFSVDGRTVEERLLTWLPPEVEDGNTLSLLSPRGLALIGLRPGESIFYRAESGRTECIRIESVSSARAPRPGPSVGAAPLRRRVAAGRPWLTLANATEGVVDVQGP